MKNNHILTLDRANKPWNKEQQALCSKRPMKTSNWSSRIWNQASTTLSKISPKEPFWWTHNQSEPAASVRPATTLYWGPTPDIWRFVRFPTSTTQMTRKKMRFKKRMKSPGQVRVNSSVWFSNSKTTTLGAFTVSTGPAPPDSSQLVPTTRSSSCSSAPTWNRMATARFWNWRCKATVQLYVQCASIPSQTSTSSQAVWTTPMFACGTQKQAKTCSISKVITDKSTASKQQQKESWWSVWETTAWSDFGTLDHLLK